ncbi:hypothetical protein CVT24_000147 [Panaeolus cyanescens]|uniref:BHLH domain-containing protein n=1 Tax=Panaeolus cyanescens TaxID=181874 RepID=A0A409WBU6_9AGAR|nr:hypothetical protein CVT24_000147 [Panaeolus cyanescens]
MPEAQPEVYAASVNPPRRAKRGPLPPTSQTDQSTSRASTTTAAIRQILPTKPYTPRVSATSAETLSEPPPAPAKRGRKPGPLSRSAREAQRRLNHSIIEKARRTKINDALATLRQLVPVDYGQKAKAVQQEQSSDEEDDDEEYQEGEEKKAKQKPKKGKREEKEKEFKLEILVRTVAFLQDLLKRVEVLEGDGSGAMPVGTSLCQGCAAQREQKKRKRSDSRHREDNDGANDGPTSDDNPHRPTKVRRNTIEEITHQPPTPPYQESIRTSHVNTRSSPHAYERISPHQHHQPAQKSHGERGHIDSNRLPPIASWLPNAMIDPRLLPPSSSSENGAGAGSYLPSPPSSTHFDPIRSSQIPPALSLGPNAAERGSRSPPIRSNFSSTSSSGRTAEDESAASLLLQMASPPIFRGASGHSKNGVVGSSSSVLTEPSTFVLHSGGGDGGRVRRDERLGDEYRASTSTVRQAQTPGSMLGIQHHRGLRGSS